jgi:hypothetical protein
MILSNTHPNGGLPPSTNRTTWPITGGAIAIQSGWYTNHVTAFFYVNLGLGKDGPGGDQETSHPTYLIQGWKSSKLLGRTMGRI